MKILQVKVNLSENKIDKAVERLRTLVESHAPDQADNTTVRANYDDVLELISAFENRQEYSIEWLE